MPDFRIWTADSRSLIALYRWPDCERIHRRLIGKVYCRKRILRELIKSLGFEAVSARVVGESGPIGTAFDAGKARCVYCLESAEAELQMACGGLLVA